MVRDNDSLVDMADYLINLLKLPANVALSGVAVEDIYYGDQTNIPRTPSACVEPGTKTRQLQGAPRRTQVDKVCHIIVYHAEVGSSSDLRKEADKTSEKIEGIIHADPYMTETVMDSMVTAIDSGYLLRRNTLYRASRLTVEARAMKQLPSQFS